MSVFRETSIEWAGETYTFTPSMRLLRQIEQEVSIMHTALAMHQGKPKISHMAFIIASVMAAAGARVTEEEIAAELAGGDAQAITNLYGAVMDAISPQKPNEKKANAAPE